MAILQKQYAISSKIKQNDYTTQEFIFLIYLTEMKTYIYTNTYTQMFILLFRIAKNWKYIY